MMERFSETVLRGPRPYSAGAGLLLRVSLVSNCSAPSIIVLDRNQIQIGRLAEVRMNTVHGDEIADLHATVMRKGEEPYEHWAIVDSAMSGTFINGSQVSQQGSSLADGDEIVFGRFSEDAECRYRFYIIPPEVRFACRIDPDEDNLALTSCEICPICLGFVVQPCILGCGHAFCADCLTKWVRSVHAMKRLPICPCCRKRFPIRILKTVPETVRGSYLEIWSTKTLLRSCNLTNCKQFRDKSVFSKTFDRQWFWNSYNAVKFDEGQRILFLWMVEATHKHALEQSASQMMIGLQNLEADPVKCYGNLLCALLLRIFELFSGWAVISCDSDCRSAKLNCFPCDADLT